MIILKRKPARLLIQMNVIGNNTIILFQKMNTINHLQIEITFKDLISKSGKRSFTASEAFDIFEKFFFIFDIKNFSKDSDNDTVLYQCGVYDWGKGKKFEIDFTRQLSFKEDGEYKGMKQLHFTLYYDAKIAS